VQHGVTRESVVSALATLDRVALAADGRRAAAVAVAVMEHDGVLGVPLTRRAARMRAHPGQWALPGGRIDDGEDAVTAAIREMDEELGLRVAASCAIGLLDDYATRSGYVITPVVLWAGAAGEPRPNPAEVASVHIATLSQLDVDPRFVMIPESDQPVIQLPIFGDLIHAPTAAVLHQFREVALHRRATRVAHFEQPVFAWR
jgi:8-oxo-dGTP pyrophosphatase MutT (NUDIX family)